MVIFSLYTHNLPKSQRIDVKSHIPVFSSWNNFDFLRNHGNNVWISKSCLWAGFLDITLKTFSYEFAIFLPFCFCILSFKLLFCLIQFASMQFPLCLCFHKIFTRSIEISIIRKPWAGYVSYSAYMISHVNVRAFIYIRRTSVCTIFSQVL